jgi:hypothetical protein
MPDMTAMPIVRRLCNWNATPDFKQIVEKSLALFGVFTGVTLSFYIKDFLFGDNIPPGFRHFSAWDRSMVALSVIALLLRYIVGSAVHLTATYVVQVTATVDPVTNVLTEVKYPPKLNSLFWLFVDILVLVGFGIVAVLIIYSADFGQFMLRSGYFISMGVGWNVIALFCRPKDRAVAERWWWIDMAQLAFTLGLILVSFDVVVKTTALAVVYLFCLFLDFCVVSRPPPP